MEYKNCHPISLLSLMSKELERLQSFLTNTFQSGFQKNSINFHLPYLIDTIFKGFDCGLYCNDFNWPFNTIDHNTLLLKMPSLQFSCMKLLIGKSHAYAKENSMLMFMTNSLLLLIHDAEFCKDTFLLFLLYISNMPQAIDCDLFL